MNNSDTKETITFTYERYTPIFSEIDSDIPAHNKIEVSTGESDCTTYKAMYLFHKFMLSIGYSDNCIREAALKLAVVDCKNSLLNEILKKYDLRTVENVSTSEVNNF